MIQTFKVMSGANHVNVNDWFLRENAENRLLRSNTEIRNGEQSRKNNLVLRRYRTDIKANTFTLRVVKGWNSLPASVQNAGTVNQFKNAYDRHKKHSNT